jgi:hypothetical protein
MVLRDLCASSARPVCTDERWSIVLSACRQGDIRVTFLRGRVGLRFCPERALERLLTIGHASGGARRRGQPALPVLVRHFAVSEADLRMKGGGTGNLL